MSAAYYSQFAIGARVEIDGDQSHTGLVTAVQFNGTGWALYEVATWVEGREQRTWIEEFRLCSA